MCHRYVTNTRVKFVLVIDEPVPKDEEMRMVRCRFSALLRSLCHETNCLLTPSSCKAFERKVSILT